MSALIGIQALAGADGKAGWLSLGVYLLPMIVLAWAFAAARARGWRKRYGWWEEGDDRRSRFRL